MIQTDRLIQAAPFEDDQRYDRAVRPKLLADYIGQPAVREQMAIFIQAARARSEALDHVLIFGPPGLGKNHISQYYRARNGRGF
jgi:Holliday junction DNA helicase RuvB